MRHAPPPLAFAVLGQAQALNELSPAHESRIVGNVLTYWAPRSTLDITKLGALSQTAPTPLPTPELSLVTAT
jgi:hypothetical protein